MILSISAIETAHPVAILRAQSLGRLSKRIIESWLGLSEQLFRFDKWNVCRV
jgi:hypothetical protein